MSTDLLGHCTTDRINKQLSLVKETGQGFSLHVRLICSLAGTRIRLEGVGRDRLLTFVPWVGNTAKKKKYIFIHLHLCRLLKSLISVALKRKCMCKKLNYPFYVTPIEVIISSDLRALIRVILTV